MTSLSQTHELINFYWYKHFNLSKTKLPNTFFVECNKSFPSITCYCSDVSLYVEGRAKKSQLWRIRLLNIYLMKGKWALVICSVHEVFQTGRAVNTDTYNWCLMELSLCLGYCLKTSPHGRNLESRQASFNITPRLTMVDGLQHSHPCRDRPWWTLLN